MRTPAFRFYARNFLMAIAAAAAFALPSLSAGRLCAEDFRGYECTDDCSGHRAGYEWAQDQEIKSEEDCFGSSRSFEEGCTAYVEENGSGGDGSD
ncbi:MAG: hypothetical protein LBW85_08765 [Deltaproteobacteria bacterium]|jgi:hypothetical protein|nr:hypothetical protein [Deltaproteobacteria bacterium]